MQALSINRVSSIFVQKMESMDDSGGCISCIDSCLDPSRCLVSKLWKPFQVVVGSPGYSAVILLILYIVFILLWLPFWLTSFAVGSWGSLFILCYLLVWGLRAFARTISFPGSSKSLQRDFSLDYIRRTVQQVDHFGTLASNFAVLIANSSKTRSRLNSNGGPSPARESNKSEDPIMYKAAELEAWCDEMTNLHVCLSDAIEDYRYTAYKQSSSGHDSSGGAFGGLRGGGSSSGSGSKNLQRGAAFTLANLFSFRGLGKMADKVTEKVFAGVSICTGKSPINKEEINEVLNPAIVVRDSFGSLLEHTSNLIRVLSAFGHVDIGNSMNSPPQQQSQQAQRTPPRRDRSSSSSSTSTVGSPGSEVAELVASISMVIRYSDQLRNALMYMVVQAEHNDEKRKEMNERISPVNRSSGSGGGGGGDAEEGLGSILEVSNSAAPSSGFLGSLTKQIAPGSQIVTGILNMNQGPRGPANLSFGLMRAQLTNRSGAHRFRVIGCDDNVIDCIYIPAKGFQSAYGEQPRSGGGKDKAAGAGREGAPPRSRGSSDSLGSHGSGTSYTSSGSSTEGEGALPSVGTGVPPSRSRSRSHSGLGSGVAKPVPSEVGTVLFCGPNAGMYESFSMASPESSWLGYYTQLGLDVVFFNYRGYNLSTGLPQPEGIQNDGIFVLEYLKSVLGVRKVVVHGESIGGMVATAIARHFDCSDSGGGDMDMTTPSASYNNLGDIEIGGEGGNTATGSGSGSREEPPFRIKMLVCDRTFASLDAVAARFLGVWAAYGLVYLGPWQTDCVTPYLEADTDMKVIIQDPEDAIIDHAASLKTGVATYSSTGETRWWPRKPTNTGYRKSVLLHEMPVFDPEATKEPFKLDAKFVEAVCVAIIGLAQQTQSGADDAVEAGQPYDADADALLGTSSRGAAYSEGAKSKDGGGAAGGGRGTDSGIPSRGRALSMQSYRPTKEWLRVFCTQSVAESNKGITPLEKVFLVIASLDGRCGELCGHAVIGGFDNLFPFFSQLVHWSPRSFGSTRTVSKGASNHMKAVGRSLSRVCEDLEKLVYGQQQPNGLSSHSGVAFLRAAMLFMRERVQHVEAAAKLAHSGKDSGSSATDSSGALFSPPRGKGVPPTPVEGLLATVAVSTTLAEEFEREHSGSTSGSGSGGKLPGAVSAESVPSPAGPMSPGFLINVNCGHSGWPSKKALDTLTLCVAQAGFDIKQPCS